MASADLHVHSKASKRPSEWFLQKVGAKESYTEIDVLYSMAKSMGMDFVTVTDHNTIEGALELVEKYPDDTFISVETTTYFPENNCKIHILIFDITKDQFERIEAVRYDIYQLRDLIRELFLFYEISDLLVFPDTGDHSGWVILEAQSRGIPAGTVSGKNIPGIGMRPFMTLRANSFQSRFKRRNITMNSSKALPERREQMKILYGIQGTGNGHVSRATQIIKQLRNLGAQVDVIFSGCGEDKVYDPSLIESPMFYKGFTFCVKNGRIRLFNTIQNLSLRRFIRYAFLHNIPMDRSNPLSKWIIKYFAPADVSIGMHWHHFDQPIVPPVIPSGMTVSETVDESLILVYLPFENRAQIRDLISPFKYFKFSVYAQNQGEEIKEDDNITWHPFSKTLFFKDLTQCNGVISNAGFELPSEALSLGKKILVKPLKGQFEQISNAMALDLLGLGASMPSLDRQSVEKWLGKTKTVTRKYLDVAGHIADWVMTGDFSSTERLVEKTWQAA